MRRGNQKLANGQLTLYSKAAAFLRNYTRNLRRYF
jgi:hypothetical protein